MTVLAVGGLAYVIYICHEIKKPFTRKSAWILIFFIVAIFSSICTTEEYAERFCLATIFSNVTSIYFIANDNDIFRNDVGKSILLLIALMAFGGLVYGIYGDIELQATLCIFFLICSFLWQYATSFYRFVSKIRQQDPPEGAKLSNGLDLLGLLGPLVFIVTLAYQTIMHFAGMHKEKKVDAWKENMCAVDLFLTGLFIAIFDQIENWKKPQQISLNLLQEESPILKMLLENQMLLLVTGIILSEFARIFVELCKLDETVEMLVLAITQGVWNLVWIVVFKIYD
jgi:hypothetical protein